MRDRLARKVSGDPGQDWVGFTLAHHLNGRLPLPRCLSLGCGRGDLERGLARKGVFVECDAVDIAEGALNVAKEKARAQGHLQIHYRLQDLNILKIPEGHYDVIWSHDALHHVTALEGLCAEIAKGLKPDGLFVMHEYVGPARFQFPLRQKEIIQSCFTLLPERYRLPVRTAPGHSSLPAPHRRGGAWIWRRLGDKLRDGDLAAAVWRRLSARIQTLKGKAGPCRLSFPTPGDVAAADPSEAIRSHEILPLIPCHFDVKDHKPLGGSLLQFLLRDIAGHFRTEDPLSMEWLRQFFEIEDLLVETGEMSSDFAYVVASPKRP